MTLSEPEVVASAAVGGARRSPLRQLFTIERPPPPTTASRLLRAVIAVTAVTTVVVEVVNLGYADEAGFALGVRTVWALLRALGFLFLMRAVRYGRQGSRPFGLIIAITTIFSVARLVLPRSAGLLPTGPVLAGFVLLTLLCAAVIGLLYGSDAVDRHLSRRPNRRQVPPWVLTTRIAALSYSALLLVPCLVAAGSLGEGRLAARYAGPIVAGWLVFSFAVGLVVSWLTIFLVFGKRWPRTLLVLVSLGVLVIQPALCALLLGPDAVIRDGVPLVVSVLLALLGIWRSRQ